MCQSRPTRTTLGGARCFETHMTFGNIEEEKVQHVAGTRPACTGRPGIAHRPAPAHPARGGAAPPACSVAGRTSARRRRGAHPMQMAPLAVSGRRRTVKRYAPTTHKPCRTPPAGHVCMWHTAQQVVVHTDHVAHVTRVLCMEWYSRWRRPHHRRRRRASSTRTLFTQYP